MVHALRHTVFCWKAGSCLDRGIASNGPLNEHYWELEAAVVAATHAAHAPTFFTCDADEIHNLK
jgi:hypothetical protein